MKRRKKTVPASPECLKYAPLPLLLFLLSQCVYVSVHWRSRSVYFSQIRISNCYICLLSVILSLQILSIQEGYCISGVFLYSFWLQSFLVFISFTLIHIAFNSWFLCTLPVSMNKLPLSTLLFVASWIVLCCTAWRQSHPFLVGPQGVAVLSVFYLSDIH